MNVIIIHNVLPRLTWYQSHLFLSAHLKGFFYICWYMLVYVDDIILTRIILLLLIISSKVLVTRLQFKTQDIFHIFLGIEAIRKHKDLVLSQRKYILQLLQRANLSKAKPVSSPNTTTANLFLGDSPLFFNLIRYRQMVGALQYVTLSRPDITFAVNKVCQFMHSPTKNH